MSMVDTVSFVYGKLRSSSVEFVDNERHAKASFEDSKSLILADRIFPPFFLLFNFVLENSRNSFGFRWMMATFNFEVI